MSLVNVTNPSSLDITTLFLQCVFGPLLYSARKNNSPNFKIQTQSELHQTNLGDRPKVVIQFRDHHLKA